MLPYALPLTFGLVGAVAVAVILVEVVPKILEDRERNRRERERTRRGRVPVAVWAAWEEGRATALKRERGQAAEREQGEWKLKVRQRKGRKVVGGGRGPDEDHLLSPTKSHRVLGSDFEATDNDNDENVPLAQLSSRPRSRTPSSSIKTATHLTPATTGAATEDGTAPLFSPALSLESASTSTPFEHLSPEPSPFADTDADAPSTLLPSAEQGTDESRSPTLVGGGSSSSPAHHSFSTFSSPLPVAVEEENPFADAAQPLKPAGQILFELPDEDDHDRLSSTLSEDGWVRSPTLNSDAGTGSGGSELGDGWTKLSDEEESADEGEAEWAKVGRSAGGGAGVGLGLQPAGVAH